MPSCYDTLSGAYLRLWEPVLGPSGRSLLDRLERLRPDLAAQASRTARAREILDVGTGTGILAREAVRRWPGVRVTAVDTSSGMLDAARARAEVDLTSDQLARVEFRDGAADRIPVADRSVDAVVSSFVLQLVPSRPAALREARRVLRPGGIIALVTWIADDTPFRPADAFDDALADLGIDVPGDEPGRSDGVSGDYASAAAAVRQLRRAGFAEVIGDAGWLEHAWDAESYLRCQEELWESDLFSTLSGERRRALLEQAARRLRALRAEDFRWRAPIVFALGRR